MAIIAHVRTAIWARMNGSIGPVIAQLWDEYAAQAGKCTNNPVVRIARVVLDLSLYFFATSPANHRLGAVSHVSRRRTRNDGPLRICAIRLSTAWMLRMSIMRAVILHRLAIVLRWWHLLLCVRAKGLTCPCVLLHVWLISRYSLGHWLALVYTSPLLVYILLFSSSRRYAHLATSAFVAHDDSISELDAL